MPSVIDAILILFEHLSAEDQVVAYQRLTGQHARNLVGEHSETERLILAMRVVEAHVEGELSPDAYKAVYRQLKADGMPGLVEFNQLVRYFGSWRAAKEALALSGITTARKIDARFRHRRLGKVWRYTDQTLEETLAACSAYCGGRAPMVAEFDCWRERELELARAQGNDALHLPSPHPYRKRWGSWEGALIRFGYTVEQRAARHELP